MPSKGGCNKDYYGKLENPGTKNKMRQVPAQFARNDLAKGGVNRDPQHKGGKGKAA